MNILRLTLAVVVACAGIDAGHAMDFPANHAVPDARLDTVRGGFDFGDNLRASFALERTVMVNGVEAIRQSVTIPDVAQMSVDQANALRNALGTVVVSNGNGGVTADAIASNHPVTMPATMTSPNAGAGAGLIVQNSVNDTSIMATTKIDAAVNTSALLQNMRVGESIKDAVIQFRGN